MVGLRKTKTKQSMDAQVKRIGLNSYGKIQSQAIMWLV